MPDSRILDELQTEFDQLKEEDHFQKANLLKEMTILYFGLQDYEKANETNDLEIELREKLGVIEDIFQAKQNNAALTQMSWEFEKAEKLYLDNFEYIKNLDSFELKDQSLYSIASINQHYIGNFLKAHNYYKLGFELAEKAENFPRQAFFIDHMGMAKYWFEEFDEAIEYHNQSWKILQDSPRDINHLFHKIQLALSYIGNEDYEQALKELLSVLDLKLTNTDIYSNVDYYLALSQISKYEYDLILSHATELNTICGEDLTSEALIEIAREIAIEKDHVKSIVQANVFLAEEVIARNKLGGLKLISEAYNRVTRENRTKEIAIVKQFLNAHKLSIDDLNLSSDIIK